MTDNKKNYQKAYEEWENRIGNAKIQARNWRFAAIASLILAILLLVAIIIESSRHHDFVYVAEVKTGENVINVVPTNIPYQPTVAQKEAFIGKFIKNINNIPLDPVVLNHQWQLVVSESKGKSIDILKEFYNKLSPFKQLGIYTQNTKIINANTLSKNSFDVSWQVIRYNKNGEIVYKKLYEGIFTLVENSLPKTFNQMLSNPLGFKIGYFSYSEKGSSQ